MTTVGSTGFNPYADPFVNGYLNQYATGSNGDFMQQAYFPQDNTYAAQNPMFNLAAMQNQPAQDTFEKSGRSSLGDGIKLGALAGIGTTAGMYYLGGDHVSPIVNGKFSDRILTSLEKDTKEVSENKALEKFAKEKEAVYKKVKVGGDYINAEQHKAIEEFIKLKEANQQVPTEILNKVPQNIKTQTNFTNLKGDLYTLDTKINSINLDTIAKEATKEAKEGHLGTQLEQMQNLLKRKSLLEGLAKDANEEQIIELIKKNPKAFGIEATETAKIETEAKNLAQGWKTKQRALEGLEPIIEAQKNTVENVRNAVNSRFAHYWDSTSKTLTESAPKELKSAINSLKFNKAGKIGLIAAGVAAVLGFAFGGSKS